MINRQYKIIWKTAALVSLIFIWKIISITKEGSFLPSPEKTISRAIVIFPSILSLHITVSFIRIAIALLFAVIFAYPAGVAAALYKRADLIISPISYILYPIPKIALLPLFLLFFGIGEISKIVIVFSVIFFQILISVRDSVKRIETEYFISISIMGGKINHIIKYVIWPHTLPGMLSALRISAATSLSVLFFAETFGTKKGLGFFIMDSWMRIAYDDMMAGILSISLLGIILFTLLDIAEKKICSWKK